MHAPDNVDASSALAWPLLVEKLSLLSRIHTAVEGSKWSGEPTRRDPAFQVDWLMLKVELIRLRGRKNTFAPCMHEIIPDILTLIWTAPVA